MSISIPNGFAFGQLFLELIGDGEWDFHCWIRRSVERGWKRRRLVAADFRFQITRPASSPQIENLNREDPKQIVERYVGFSIKFINLGSSSSETKWVKKEPFKFIHFHSQQIIYQLVVLHFSKQYQC